MTSLMVVLARLLSLLSLSGLIVGTLAVQLDMVAPASQLCPVIKYETMVLELSPMQLSSMKLSAKLLDASRSAESSQSKPFQVILLPLTFAHNASKPSVDWIDLHFKVNAETQENVQMKLKSAVSLGLPVSSSASGSSSVAPEVDSSSNSHMSMMPHHSSESMAYAFGPIFLSSTDELTYAHTICSNMIDCITESHTFKRQSASAPASAPPTPPLPVTQPIMKAQPVPSPSPVSKPEVIPPTTPSQPAPSEVQPASGVGCPAIAYRYAVSCGDSQCKVSFINLTPEKTLDWVDIHLRTNTSSLTLGTMEEFSFQNFRMKLAAGVKGQHHMSMQSSIGSSAVPMTESEKSLTSQRESSDMAQLNSQQDLLKFGPESSPQALLSAVGANQVWQFGLPIEFQSGDRLSVWFTYCAMGVDCDTEQYQLILTDQQQQQQPQQSAQVKLQQSVPQQAAVLMQSHPQLPTQLIQQIPSSLTFTTVNEQTMIPLSLALNMAHLNPNMPMQEFQRLASIGAIQNWIN